MAMSTSSAPARPIKSAPMPRAGNSTTCGRVCSSPTTISAASRGDEPGHDPMPVAAAKTLTRLTIFDPVRLDPEGDDAMPASARSVTVWLSAVLVVAGCTQTVDGRALRAAPGIDDESLSPVDVETLILDQSQMRAITG